MSTTFWCLHCNAELPVRTGSPGRPAEYCGSVCRQAAYRQRRRPKAGQQASQAAAVDTAARELARDVLEEARHLVRLLERPDAPLLDPVEQAVTLARGMESLTAALVQRARHGRVTWTRLGAALSVQADTARRTYRADVIGRRISVASAESVPSGQAEVEAAAPTQPPHEPRQSRSHLAPVLSRLQRASAVTLRTLADRLGISPSLVSRILSGERFPSWQLTERFAHICGADPMVLRKVWEDEKLHEHRPRSTLPPADDPAARLQVALRTLHIKAGRPPVRVLAEATRHSLAPEEVATSLTGRASWPQLADLVQTLGGDPAYFLPLWDATQTVSPADGRFRPAAPTRAAGPEGHLPGLLQGFGPILAPGQPR